MTAIAPTTSNQRRYRLPCLVMLPSRSLPPVVCCFGTNPIQAARLRPDENVFQSPISATRAVAPIGPPPRNLRQPLARLARAMQDKDTLVDGSNLGSDGTVLSRQHIENAADGCRKAVIRTIRDDPEQLSRSIAALGRHDAEFSQVPA